MDTIETNKTLTKEFKKATTPMWKDKFELVGCPVNGMHCTSILPEINALYGASEMAHMDKEYVKAAELLQKAFHKTLELKQPGCAACVEMFQGSIKQTMKVMEDEVYGMSVGFFRKKRYEKLHLILTGFINRMKMFPVKEAKVYSPNESVSVS